MLCNMEGHKYTHYTFKKYKNDFITNIIQTYLHMLLNENNRDGASATSFQCNDFQIKFTYTPPYKN